MSKDEFNKLISEDLVLVDFFATWCGPCKMLSPIIDELVNERQFKVVKIDVDQNMELAQEYGIMSVPTLILFSKGKLLAKKSGFVPKEVLVEWINANK
ncbi:MAG: thioredoxin [Bacilli bacterium]|nr:thioredoxin [Bacilli bacterium]MDD4607859.1 thioredoxin [Bacilli bacterium]